VPLLLLEEAVSFGTVMVRGSRGAYGVWRAMARERHDGTVGSVTLRRWMRERECGRGMLAGDWRGLDVLQSIGGGDGDVVEGGLGGL